MSKRCGVGANSSDMKAPRVLCGYREKVPVHEQAAGGREGGSGKRHNYI